MSDNKTTNLIIIAVIILAVLAFLFFYIKDLPLDEFNEEITSWDSCYETCQELYADNPDYVKSLCIDEQANICLSVNTLEQCSQVNYEEVCTGIMSNMNLTMKYSFVCMETCS